MGSLWHDLRYSLRTLSRTPGFTAVAVLTLALGIGMNATMFSVVNTVLLQPLPLEEPERLVQVWETNLRQNRPRVGTSVRNYADWRAPTDVFEAMGGYQWQNYNLTGGEEPLLVSALTVSTNLPAMLGITPVLGRSFFAEEEQPGRHRVALLSDGLWRRHFGASPEVVGRSLILDDAPYTVIGVLPPTVEFPTRSADLWTPLSFDAGAYTLDQRVSNNLSVVARLRPDASVAQARSEMEALAAQTYRQYPESYPPDHGWGVAVVPVTEQFIGPVRPSLLMLLGAVACVLLIACVNLAHLLLARGAARQTDMAIRVAIGARRRHIVRQWLAESLLLALAGGTLGMLLSLWGVDLLKTLNPGNIPRLHDLAIDPRTLGFTALISLATGVGIGLVPVLRLTLRHPAGALAGTRRGATPGAPQARLRNLFVVSEIALSLVLITGAALLIKSVTLLQQVDTGFDPERLLTARVFLPVSKYADGSAQAAFFEQALERIEEIPGVQAAGAINYLPFAGSQSGAQFIVEGRPAPPPGERPRADVFVVSDGYFRTAGLPLLRGRHFTELDAPGQPETVIINDAMARRFWPDENPVGQRLTYYWDRVIPCEIVGVVGDNRHRSLDTDPAPALFRPHRQQPSWFMGIVARTTADPAALSASLRGAVWTVDPAQPVFDAQPMAQRLDGALAQRRFIMLLLGVFAGVALLLAAVGVYGVMAYAVSRRTHEIGVRMALGAQRRDVLALVMGRGMTLALTGVLVGLGVSYVATRVMAGLLFGVSPTDPLTFAGTALLLGVVAMMACYLPARRAMRVDPVVALRQE